MLLSQVKSLKFNDKVKKSFSLFSAMVLSLITGIGISMLNTRYLGKEQYGDFKFLIDIFNFFITFLTFGFFYTGGRILAKAKEIKERKNIFGEIITIALIIGTAYILILFIYSFFQDRIFNKDLQKEILICLPFMFVIPLQLCLEQLLQGDNRIYSLSIMRLGPKVLYIGIIVSVYYLSDFNLKTALIAHLSAYSLIVVSIIFRYRPVLGIRFKYLRQLFRENKSYGFPVYLGAISGVASNYVAGFSISYFEDNVNVGFYALALTASMPLAMFPASFGITFFKDFVTLRKIPVKVIYFTIFLCISLLSGFIIFIKPIVVFLYSEEFLPVVDLAYFTGIGSLFHGFGDFFNRFLGAKGLGKQLRNANFILGGVNTLGYISFVFLFQTKGAAIIKMIAGVVYMFIMIYYYQKYLRRNDNEG